MSLTPEDIQGKRFHDAFRGYNHEEVDIFLDEVAAAFEALFKGAQEARARVEEVEAELDEVKGTEGMLKRTLLAAQRAADEAIAEAKAEAARLVAAGEDEAAAAVASAKQQGEDIIAGANARQSEIEELGCRLRDLHAAHRATLRAHLEDQLRALDDLPALPGPLPEPSSELEPGPEPAPEEQAAPVPAEHPETSPATPASPRRLAPPDPLPEDSLEPPTVGGPRPASSFAPLGPGEQEGVNPATHTGETD
ncbi:MAG: cell division initiation protein [Actinomycetota bacterium]|nr:cell division initiation protein [Actinomycetota bacterium]